MVIIVGGRQAIVVIDREAVKKISFSLLIVLKPFKGSLGQPLLQRLPGVGYTGPAKLCRWRCKWFHDGGDVFVLVIY